MKYLLSLLLLFFAGTMYAQRTIVARNEAQRAANKVKETFPEMPVYTYFQPPRWLCRVGDFKSIEEAHVAMRKLKGSGEFKEAAIVREQINIPIE